MNIAANLKAIESIKGEILGEVANLYRILSDYDELSDYGNVENSVSAIITTSYILAKHLGIAYSTLDTRITELLTIAEENAHSLETEFGDMSELKRYIKRR